MALAEKFRKDRSLGYEPIQLIADVSDSANPEKQARQYVQMVMDFIGDKSLTDLYIEHDIIKRDLKVRGGARQNTHPVRSPDEAVALKKRQATEAFLTAAQTFDTLCGRDVIKYLDDSVVVDLHQALANAYHAFSNEIKERRLGKRG